VSRLADLLTDFAPVSLDELDARAALLRRVDNKYVISHDELARLLERLSDDHQALEIDGQRAFAYESAYFDTDDLRCFHDHVQERRPRFKVRTRLYVDSDECFLEVKVKQPDDETVKEQRPVAREERTRLDADGRRFVDDTLERVTGSPLREELAHSLTSAFRRGTLVAAESAERATFDFELLLSVPDGSGIRLRGDLTILETKTADGEGTCDRVLHEAGHEPVALSKYRTGIALLVPSADADRSVERWFTAA
jgi:hypothetical protein